MSLAYDTIKNEVIGKWRGLLSSIGAELPDNPKKHGPCPICGPGRNSHRFRFDDKEGSGSWICTQCGSGDGWELYMKITGKEFVETMQDVASKIGVIDREESKPEPKTDPKIALQKVAKASVKLTGQDPVSKYLRSRGIVYQPEEILYCAQCYESETKSAIPAMIGIVKNRSGKNVTLHRTYLGIYGKAQIQSPKKLMPAICDSLSAESAAIRLFSINDTVGIAEGIETAISARQLFDIPTWAVINTSIMAGFEPPEGIKKVVIFGDNDANFVGQKAAYELANKLFLKDYIVDVQIPDMVGDWNDILIKNG
jgi:putative DNA primase/helicase